MNIAIAGTLLTVVGLAAGGTAYVHTQFVAETRFELAQAQTAVQIQLIAKESRLRDIEAAIARLVDKDSLTQAERQRLEQLQQQYGAIVAELERLK
jgi:hypothetical protein